MFEGGIGVPALLTSGDAPRSIHSAHFLESPNGLVGNALQQLRDPVNTGLRPTLILLKCPGRKKYHGLKRLK